MAHVMFVFVVILGVCLFSIVFLRWNQMRYMRKGLPPGTMGWPVFGETTEFLKHGPNFMKNKRARFGSFFKSHILGCPTIISMDPELNRYILMNEAKGLVPGYPRSMLDILGTYNISAVHGSAHKKMRGAVLALLSPAMIRDQHLLKINDFMRSHLSNWDNKIIDIQQKTKEMALLSSLKQIAGIESGSMCKEFIPEFFKLVVGTISLPIDLPNTNYRSGVQKEHLAIRESKGPDDPINWNDYKSMSFTRAVILETSRLATIVNGVLRKTTQEMELNGYIIPEGWRIYVYTRETNYDSHLYSDPCSFNPWRWLKKSMDAQNTCSYSGEEAGNVLERNWE